MCENCEKLWGETQLLIKEANNRTNQWIKNLKKHAQEPIYECEDCGSTDYPKHEELCTMGNMGWNKIKK